MLWRFEQLREQGTTILFVTHDTGTVVQFCSQALVLEGGKVFTSGTPQTVARRYHRLLFEGITDVKDSESDALPFNKSTVNAALASTQSEAQRTSEAFGSAGVTNKVHEHIDTPWGGVDSVSSNDPNVRGSGMESTSEVGSSREVRYGSREAEIVEIGLRDSRGANTKLIEVHSRYEFSFESASTPTSRHLWGTVSSFQIRAASRFLRQKLDCTGLLCRPRWRALFTNVAL